MGRTRKATRVEIGSVTRAAPAPRAPWIFHGLTALAGVCYGAPTLRRFGDLTFGPQALTGLRLPSRQRSRSAGRGGGRGVLSVIVLAVAMLAGCGPIGYMQQVHRRASEAVEEARRAGAESAAPYEYTSAVAYLAKAREEGAEAEYGNAIELGRRAEELAHQARAIAGRTSVPQAPAGPAPRERDRPGEDAEPPPAERGTAQ